MLITHLKLVQYKNLTKTELSFHPYLNLFIGNNAQGKTNLLESIYLLTGQTSFRGTRPVDAIQENKLFFRISGHFSSQRDAEVSYFVSELKQEFRLNGVLKKSQLERAKLFPSILFLPDHLFIIKHSPKERRDFLDQHIDQLKPKFKIARKEYKRILLQKNSLLKQFDILCDAEEMLTVYNQQLAKLGCYIIATRVQFLKQLLPLAQTLYQGISNATEHLTFQYETQMSQELEQYHFSAAFQTGYYEFLQTGTRQEISAKTSLYGCHKDDISFFINNKNCKTFASQGQQRSVIIVLKLAIALFYESIFKETPLILLDDVMSELDPFRMQFILNHLSGMQVFITGCDASILKQIKIEYQSFQVENGAVVTTIKG